MKTAENIINDYYQSHFENGDWEGDIKQYALRFKDMYDKEIEHLRLLKVPYETEEDLANVALSNVNYCYHDIMKQFKAILNDN